MTLRFLKIELLSYILIFTLSVISSLPLAKAGLFQIHDDQQIARLYLFDQSLKAGQFPVRWVDALGFGFGYPLFVFYPPLVYMVGEIFHLMGFGFVDSVKMVIFTSIFASGVTMYIFAKSIYGKLPALIAAAFYILAPYRAVDIYVRGALAESFSFVWLPLILWSYWKLFSTKKIIYVLSAGMFLSLLMITHNLIFLPFLLLLPLYLGYFIKRSKDKKFFVISCFISIIISLALSAFFWIPSVAEKHYTIVDQLLLVNLASYKIHFVYPQQLWNSLWGFGGSIAGPEDGLSFKLGKLHILLSFGALLFSLAFLIKQKVFSSKSVVSSLGPQSRIAGQGPHAIVLSTRRGTVYLSVVFFSLFIFSAFMATMYSHPIWDLLTPLQYLQFPWRFLTLTALFSSILAASFIWLLKVPTFKYIASTLAVTLLLTTNLKLFKPQYYRPELTDSQATAKDVINWDVSNTSFEYLPKNVSLKISEKGTNVIDITKEDVPKMVAISENTSAEISDITEKPGYVSFKISTPVATIVTINRTNFPMWEIFQNGKMSALFSDNKFKLIQTLADAGETTIVARFKDTPTRTIANLISLFSAVIIAIYLSFGKRTWLKAT